jgi:hypothetical protein
MIRLRDDLIVTGLFIVFVIWVLVLSAALSPVARLAPLTIALPTLGLAVIELIRGMRAPAPVADRAVGARERDMLAWIVALLLTCDLAGLAVGLALFVLLYLRVRSQESWALSAAVAGMAWFMLSVILSGALRVPLYGGRITGWLR